MRASPRYGVSLVEILVVLGLMGLLIGLLMPAVQAVRGRAKQVECQNNLRQLGLALHNYHSAQGRFPTLPGQWQPQDPNRRFSWMVHILPHIEQETLWQSSVTALATEPSCWVNPPHVGYSTVIKTYVCSADSRLLTPQPIGDGLTAAYASYIGVCGNASTTNGVLGLSGPGVRLEDITDGASQTVMAGERPPPDSLQAGRWYSSDSPYITSMPPGPDDGLSIPGVLFPNDICHGSLDFRPGRLSNPCDRYHFWSLHSGGANWLRADGGVLFITYANSSIMPALATRAGGESVNLP